MVQNDSPPVPTVPTSDVLEKAKQLIKESSEAIEKLKGPSEILRGISAAASMVKELDVSTS